LTVQRCRRRLVDRSRWLHSRTTSVKWHSVDSRD